jgi:hypothetical protein
MQQYMSFNNNVKNVLETNAGFPSPVPSQQPDTGWADHQPSSIQQQIEQYKTENDQLKIALKAIEEKNKTLLTHLSDFERKHLQLKKQATFYQKNIEWYFKNYDSRGIIQLLGDRLFKRKTRAINRPGYASKALIAQSNTTIVPNRYRLLRIAVFVHLYYEDLWEEVKGQLLAMGLNFDLYISLCEESNTRFNTQALIKESFPSARVFVLPNKGLDVGPFIEKINFVVTHGKEYDYCLKIHTKKSIGVDASIGEEWRMRSYDSLMSNLYNVGAILKKFEHNDQIGMIGPVQTLSSITPNDLTHSNKNVNEINIATWSKNLGITDRKLSFFGGTMFWARWSVFKTVFQKQKMCIDDFEPGYRNDGLVAHAFERIFASMVRDAKMDLYELRQEDIIAATPKKKVLWIHPGFGIGGGNRGIFEIASKLLQHYEVTSCSMIGNDFKNWMEVHHDMLFFTSEQEAYAYLINESFDYIFATGWQTVALTKALPYGKKLYFIQDYEPWFVPADKHRAAFTYNQQICNGIAIAGWLQKKLQEDHHYPSCVVPQGTRLYNHAKPVQFSKPVKVLMYFKYLSHLGRGADLMLQAMQLLKDKKDIEVHVIGHENPNVRGIHFHGELLKEALYELYGQAHFFIDLSRHRGHPTMALEVSQFGCISLFTNPDIGIKEYQFEDGKNALFIKDPEDIYPKIAHLIQHPEAYQSMQKNLIALSQNFRWQYTANSIHEIMEVHAV